jgi:hypothetical protein
MDLDKFDLNKFDFIVGLPDIERNHTDMELSGSPCRIVIKGGGDSE